MYRNVPLERTAMLIEALLGAPVSTGFVAGALEKQFGLAPGRSRVR
jgi:hypothetical protein